MIRPVRGMPSKHVYPARECRCRLDSVLVAAGSMWTTLNNTVLRVGVLEQKNTQQIESMAEVKADIKILLERTRPAVQR